MSRCASPHHARDLSLIFDGFTNLVNDFNQTIIALLQSVAIFLNH